MSHYSLTLVNFAPCHFDHFTLCLCQLCPLWLSTLPPIKWPLSPFSKSSKKPKTTKKKKWKWLKYSEGIKELHSKSKSCSGSWTADEYSVIKNFCTHFSLWSTEKKARENLNIWLFWGVKTTSPSQPSRGAALSLLCREEVDSEEFRL